MVKLTNKEIFYDISKHSLNKSGEELCGDNVEIFESKNKLIVVLADGLGSGVKANILSTLTTKIAGTMLEKGNSIEETLTTILKTLPVCKVRKVAYSTLGIIQIDKKTNIASIIEYDNPPIFYKRNNQIIILDSKKITINNKNIKLTSIPIRVGDSLTLVSDGVIHAGVGKILNQGWKWENVAGFLEKQDKKNAETYNRSLIDACNNLYMEEPGDDTTAVTLMAIEPKITNVFTGPPEDKSKDSTSVKNFMMQSGKKIICGGTAANIFARELGEEVHTSFGYVDRDVPPIAHIDGLDLVTEGILTLKKLLSILNHLSSSTDEFDFEKKDGATLLAKKLVVESTHINIWFGKALNPAHQNPELPVNLSVKLNIVGKISNILKKMGKKVKFEYL